MGSTIGRQSMGAVAPKLAELTDTVLFNDIWWPTAASSAHLLKQLEESSCP